MLPVLRWRCQPFSWNVDGARTAVTPLTLKAVARASLSVRSQELSVRKCIQATVDTPTPQGGGVLRETLARTPGSPRASQGPLPSRPKVSGYLKLALGLCRHSPRYRDLGSKDSRFRGRLAKPRKPTGSIRTVPAALYPGGVSGHRDEQNGCRGSFAG